MDSAYLRFGLFALLAYNSCFIDVKAKDCIGPSQMSKAQQQVALDEHNKIRSEAGKDATNMQALTWNDELASRAQDWANQCIWRHDLRTVCNKDDVVGQNIWATGDPSDDVTLMVQAWGAEKNYYSFKDHKCTAVCGHYTQMVWAWAKQVGCATKYCKNLNFGAYKAEYWITGCNYSTAQFLKERPYTQGKPCTECSSVIDGPWMCENNLCKPCDSKIDGNKCGVVPKTESEKKAEKEDENKVKEAEKEDEDKVKEAEKEDENKVKEAEKEDEDKVKEAEKEDEDKVKEAEKEDEDKVKQAEKEDDDTASNSFQLKLTNPVRLLFCFLSILVGWSFTS